MGFIRRAISKTLSMPNAGGYTANDQVGGANTLSNACASTGGTVEVESISVVDKAKQSLALDVFFFDSSPTLASADNAEFEMTDANLLAQCKGVVRVAAGDYSASKNGSFAQVRNLGLFLKALASSKDLYCVAVTRGAPTYADGDISLIIGCKQGTS
jgi:hypothetical protein